MKAENFEIYYKPSGSVSPVVMVVLLPTLLAAAALGVAYSLATWYIPIVYFNFILTLAFGVVIGFLVYPVVRLGKVRSHRAEIAMQWVIGFIGYYASWAAYVTLAYNITGEGTVYNQTAFVLDDFLFFFTHTVEMNQMVEEIASFGLWGFGSITVKGFALIFVWAIEAIIIITLIQKTNRGWAKTPFSEITGEWLKPKPLDKKLVLSYNSEKYERALKEDKMDVFLDAPTTDDFNLTYTEIVLFESPGDTDCFLSFYNKTLQRDNQGKKTSHYARISDFIQINENQKNQLESHFGVMEKPLNIFKAINQWFRSAYKI